MQILHIIQNLSLGGMQTFTVDLANEQLTQGHDVAIATLEDSSNEFLLGRLDSEIPVINLKSGAKFYNILLMRRIMDIIPRDAVSTVHTHGIAQYFSVIASLCRRNTKFVHTVHNLAQNEAGRIRRWIARFSYTLNLSFPVTISNEVSESFRECYPYIRFRQINNGLSSRIHENEAEKQQAESDLKELKANGDTKIYLSVGRIDKQKNREVLVDAFYEFAAERNVVLAIIGGPIDETNHFYSALASHPAVLEKKVYFIGVRANVHDYLRHSDYFCLTSLFEGLPISVLEAIREGLICICTPAGGIPSILGEFGYMSSDFTSNAVIASLIEAEGNPKGLTSEIISDHFKKNWNMTACSDAYTTLYQALD